MADPNPITCRVRGCGKPLFRLARRLCGMHNARWLRYRRLDDPASPERLFWPKVDKSGGPEACWPWLAGRFNTGYGCFSIDRKAMPASRASWLLTYGPIPDGLWVLHKCDNPPCCNPAHLFLGTHQDNMQDKVSKGRHTFGARQKNAKLTDDAVREIRSSTESGLILAARYGVSGVLISLVRRRKYWAHVT